MKLDINTGIDSHETMDHCKMILKEMSEIYRRSTDKEYKSFLLKKIRSYNKYIKQTYEKNH